MRAALFIAAGAIALQLPAPCDAHLIDEIAQNIVLDIATKDARTFGLTYALHDSHIKAFYSQARQLGIATEESDAAFALQLAKAFEFADCKAAPSAEPAYEPQPNFRAWVLVLSCPRVMPLLPVRRVDYRRAKTRTTLYIGVRVAGRATRRLVVPPRMAGLEVPIMPDLVAVARPTDATPIDSHEGHAESASGDSANIESNMPDPDTARRARGTAWLIPPPTDVLLAWADEGARHLMFGPDHLLFLLAIVLCAGSARWLALAVLLFSIGHLAAMGAALSFGLPGHAAIEIGIGLSIVWAGWRAMNPAGGRELRTGAGVFGFGLVHGWAFGSELGRLVLGVDGLLWPLLSFGVGLDVAQITWCGVWYVGLRHGGRLVPPLQKPENAAKLRRATAIVVVLGGAVFAVAAVTRVAS